MERLKYKRIVVKIGSNVLTKDDKTLDIQRITSLVAQIVRIKQEGVEVILVSSGAVASGRSELGHIANKLDTVSARQLYSAVGQAKLINLYYDLFRKWDITCGQVLTTKESLSTRMHYLNQRNCMRTMLANGIIPILNENDTIAITELMFTDNDELSGMVSAMMNAEALIILSNVDGIYNSHPDNAEAHIIREISSEHDISKCIYVGTSKFGRGGMLTKYRISRKVAEEGIEVIIANGKRENILTDIAKGNEIVCTRFLPARKPMSSVKKWIAHSDGFAKGKLFINEGAYKALMGFEAASLLPVGVCRVEGEFERDDIVQIIAPNDRMIGIGKITLSSDKACQKVGTKGGRPFIHYDYMFLEQKK